jgi:hypothetical protein
MPTILQTLLVNSFHGNPVIEIIVSPLLSPPNDLKSMLKPKALNSSNRSYPFFFPNGWGPFSPTCTVSVIEMKFMQGGTGGLRMGGTGRGGRGGTGEVLASFRRQGQSSSIPHS